MPEKGCFGALSGVFLRSIRFLINNLMFCFDLLRSGWIIFKIFLQKCRNEFAYFEILSLSERCARSDSGLTVRRIGRDGSGKRAFVFDIF